MVDWFSLVCPNLVFATEFMWIFHFTHLVTYHEYRGSWWNGDEDDEQLAGENYEIYQWIEFRMAVGSYQISEMWHAICGRRPTTFSYLILISIKSLLIGHHIQAMSHTALGEEKKNRIHTEYTKVQFCRRVNPIQLSKQSLLEFSM